MKIKYFDLVIIGSGVSGSFAAIHANDNFKTCLIEQNNQILKKFMITGKGKSNIANNSPTNVFLKNLIGANKFMYPSLNLFNGNNTLNFLDQYLINYYQKQLHRFHLSDSNEKFRDLILSLIKQKQNLSLMLNTTVTNIKKDNDQFIIDTNNDIFVAKYVIVATGGLSFKNTGCNGFGYKIAKQFNHNIEPLYPIGVGVYVDDNNIKSLQGISIDDVNVKVFVNDNLIYEETGPLMFTHYGLGGPVIRRVSGYISYNLLQKNEIEIIISYINEQKIIDELNTHHYLNQCFKDVNKKIIRTLLADYNDNLDLKNLNLKQKQQIIDILSKSKYKINKTDDIDVAINTGGGISLKQLNPNNFESTIVKNLFFIGETIDINPRTNGYNITCCFSMAYKCIDYLNLAIKNKNSE